MEKSWLLEHSEHGVHTITFNRPEAKNAMSREMRVALTEKLQELEADPSVRVLVFRGSGGSFIAGGDVKSFAETLHMEGPKRKGYFTTRVNESTTFVMTLAHFPKPVISVIEGDVAGAGISIALCSDFIIAGESSRFTFAHVHVGLALDVGLSYLLPRNLGLLQAKRLTMLGERIDAAEAQKLGLITSLAADSEVEGKLQKLLEKLAKMSTPALAAIKSELMASSVNDLPTQLCLESSMIGATAGTEEFKQRVSAFVGK